MKLAANQVSSCYGPNKAKHLNNQAVILDLYPDENILKTEYFQSDPNVSKNGLKLLSYGTIRYLNSFVKNVLNIQNSDQHLSVMSPLKIKGVFSILDQPQLNEADRIILDQFNQDLFLKVKDAKCMVLSGSPITPYSDQKMFQQQSNWCTNLYYEIISPLLKKIDVFNQKMRNVQKIKILGICGGHQVIHHAYGGKISKMQDGVSGVQSVHPIGLKSINQGFRILAANQGYVEKKAPDFSVWLTGKNDQNLATIGKKRTCISIQYHPERTEQSYRPFQKAKGQAAEHGGKVHYRPFMAVFRQITLGCDASSYYDRHWIRKKAFPLPKVHQTAEESHRVQM